MKKITVYNRVLMGGCLLMVLCPIQVLADLELTKKFSREDVAPGSDVVLKFTLVNTDKDFAVAGITFTDDLKGMSEQHDVKVVPPIPEPECGTLESVSDNSLLRFTKGSLAANTSCTFSVTIHIPDGFVFREMLTNYTSKVSGIDVTGNHARDFVLVNPSLTNTTKLCSEVFNRPTPPTFTCADADFRIDGADGMPGSKTAVGSDSAVLEVFLDALDIFIDDNWGGPPPSNLVDNFFSKADLAGDFDGDGRITSFDLAQRGNLSLAPRASDSQSAAYGSQTMVTFVPVIPNAGSHPGDAPIDLDFDYTFSQRDPSDNAGKGLVRNAASARISRVNTPDMPVVDIGGTAEFDLDVFPEPKLFGSFDGSASITPHTPGSDDSFDIEALDEVSFDAELDEPLELGADTFGSIFTDGFESGDSSAWSSSSPDTFKVGISSTNPDVRFKLVIEPEVPASLSPIHRFVSFNSDGKDDVLLRNQTNGGWLIDFMNFRFVRPNSGPAKLFKSQDWELMGTGDFAGNGRGDVLLRHKQLGVWQIFFMNGRNSNGGPTSITPDREWVAAAVDDFNGDGKDDVLLRNQFTGDWRIFFMNFRLVRPNSGPTTLFSDFEWELMGTGDFNGSGRADVLMRNQLTGKWWIFMMNGRRNNSGGTAITTDMDWQIAGIDDFNGDGKDDVLLRNRVTGRWRINFMNFRSVRANSGPTALFANQNWEMRGTGDFSGKGRAGILLRHRLTGRWWIFLMTGRTATSGGTPILKDKNWALPVSQE